MKQHHRDYKDNSNTKKIMKDLLKVERRIGQEKQQVQCACLHNKMGVMTLQGIPNGNGKTYRCTLCDKPVDIRRVSDDQFFTAIKTLDKVCDHLKINCNAANKADKKLANELAQTQFALYKLEVYYEASKNQSSKRQERENNRNNRRRGDVTFI